MVNARKEELDRIVEKKFDLSYDERKQAFDNTISLGTFASDNVYEKLVLVSLVSLVYIKVKDKKPTTRAIDILNKITADEEKSSFYQEMLESLGILVEEFSFGCKTSNSFGLTDSKQIVMKIKEILSTWVPF